MLNKDPKYKEICKEMLNEFSISTLKDEETKRKEYCFFFPQVGKNYFTAKTKILFAGRAQNIWGGGIFKPHDVKNKLNSIINDAINFSEPNEENECSMKWIVDCWYGTKGTEYEKCYPDMRLNKSQFWRVIKGVTNKVQGEKEIFTESIAWTQYYKIAPKDGGNPDRHSESTPQDDNYAYDLLEREIEILKPDYLIYFIGKNWMESCFDYPDDYILEKTENKYVCGKLKIKDFATKCIIVDRPESKPLHPFIEEVCKTIK
ncbi:MAG: hypothetical protein WCL14_12755 [Bacteroidota bacterium]